MSWRARRRDDADLRMFLAAAEVGPARWQDIAAAAGVGRLRAWRAVRRLEVYNAVRGAWFADDHGNVRRRLYRVRK